MSAPAAINIPTELGTQLVSAITTNFAQGLTFVAPILVAVVGMNVVRRVINRGKNGRV